MHIAECACYFIPDYPQNNFSFYCPGGEMYYSD